MYVKGCKKLGKVAKQQVTSHAGSKFKIKLTKNDFITIQT